MAGYKVLRSIFIRKKIPTNSAEWLHSSIMARKLSLSGYIEAKKITSSSLRFHHHSQKPLLQPDSSAQWSLPSI